MEFWQISLILSIIFNVTFTQYYRIATQKSTKDAAITVILQTIAGITTLFSAPFFKIQFPNNITYYIFLGLTIIFYAISNRFQTPVRRKLEASTCAILGQLYNVFMILFGILIFKEKIVLLKILGALIIIFCNAILFYQKGEFKLNKYAWIGVLQNLFLATAAACDVGISDKFNLGLYVSFEFFAAALLIIIFEKIKLKDIKQEFDTGDIKSIVITGFSWGLFALLNLLAYNTSGSVTTVAPLAATSVLLNIIVSYIFLKEKDYISKKVIASIGIIFAIFLIAIA